MTKTTWRRCLALVFAPLALILMPAGALGQSGATFTTINASADGGNHCLNGNPAVNCNIYGAKEHVWLNGGPTAAALGDGIYFFAVLAPGGQADPNDGTPKNLSDDHDTYENRTFSVGGGTIAYTGTHTFDSNKIRLADYADTPNPGGVYILAICSLKKGYPVAPRTCKYDAFKVKAANSTPTASDPVVTKDAAGAYDNTYAWDIDKSVDKTLVQQVGGSVTFTYTVSVSHDSGTPGNVTVAGDVTVSNFNIDADGNTLPISGVDVTDELSDGTTCTVAGGNNVTLVTDNTVFSYSCSLSALPSSALDNTVEVSWPAQTLGNGAALAAGSDDFTFEDIEFTGTDVDECADVTDAFDGGLAGSLGNVCVGGDNPTEFEYSRVIQVPANGCLSYDNTATFETNDTLATDSASATVTVCGPAKTGALTIGFWKNTNGNSLIQHYCAPAGKMSLASYLSTLGGANSPFKGAAGMSCTSLVTFVNNMISGASSTNMNLMLRAQMLATALNVYFSDPSRGYTTTAVPKTKPPSWFLPGVPIGAFVMDLTAVCPMVANSLTGAATCQNNTPSTNGFTAGALPSASMTVQAILTHASTSPSPFNGSTSNPVWYAGDRTKQEIAKNVFDQINNQLAFGG